MDTRTATKALRASIRFSNEICTIMEHQHLLPLLSKSSVPCALRQAIKDMKYFVDKIDDGIVIDDKTPITDLQEQIKDHQKQIQDLKRVLHQINYLCNSSDSRTANRIRLEIEKLSRRGGENQE